VFAEIAKLDSQMLRNQLQELQLEKIEGEVEKKEPEDPQLVTAC
jgi:hypothetical protein